MVEYIDITDSYEASKTNFRSRGGFAKANP